MEIDDPLRRELQEPCVGIKRRSGVKSPLKFVKDGWPTVVVEKLLVVVDGCKGLGQLEMGDGDAVTQAHKLQVDMAGETRANGENRLVRFELKRGRECGFRDRFDSTSAFRPNRPTAFGIRQQIL